MRTWFRRYRAISVSTVFLAMVLQHAAFGQTLTSLSGTVSDPSGAVVPNATLAVTNIETGFTQNSTSDGAGRYGYPQLPTGKYKLSAKATGFPEEVRSNIELLVGTATTVNIAFTKVGSTSETISVVADAVQVNTSDATIGNAISSQAIVELPSFARNVASLLQFEPGVTTNGQVNGGKSDQANVTLDGVDVNDQNGRAAFTSVLRVTLDSTAEFRTTTTNANADEGRSSGAQIALVTRSGSNTLHGSLYEYRRGSETSANTFFNNLSGVARPALLINIFGGSAGGAIKKNRLFYFGNYEGRRDASSSSATRTVPSDIMRNGGLQYLNTAGAVTTLNATQIQQLDPAHIGLSAATTALFQQYPHQNDFSGALGDGYNFVGYRFNAPVHADQNTYLTRFDWQVDSAAKHVVFVRGQLQNDSQNGLPEFPGQAPASVTLVNAKGIALGYTATLKPNLVSTLHYGLTRNASETTGVLSGSYAFFRNLSTINPTTTGSVHIIPVHFVSEDLAWNKGAHSIRFGGVMRFVSNSSTSTANSFSNTSSNPSWLLNTGKDLQPADLASSFRTNFTYAMAASIGIQAQGTANYNNLVDGTVLPVGAPVIRDFKNEEYEWYAQDTWKATRELTITYGIRHSIMPPIHEANGQQTSTNVSIGDWFYTRANLAAAGLPQSQAPTISFIAPNAPGARGLYPNHLTNFAPRLAVAYSPSAKSGLSRLLFGDGKTSIRAGWGMFYDLFGQPLAQTYASDAFGLSTQLTNPSSSLTSVTAARYTGFYSPPAALFPPAPKTGFPVTYPTSAFAITNGIDDTLKAPYTMNTDFSIGREFDHGWFVQGSYVMRLSRRSLIHKDLAMPTNLVDKASGMTYFQAAQALAKMYNNGVNSVPTASVPKIAFWEDLWPGLAGGGLTATQQAYKKFGSGNAPDYTSALQDIDINCNPSCSIFGPGAIFNQQFSALGAFSSVGRGDYYSTQWTVRKQFSQGLLLDFNYTFGRSVDLASNAENGTSFSGVIQNAWFPQQQWADSSYDARHIFNFYAVWQLPVGKDRKFLGNSNRVVDAIAGGWQLTPTVQFSSGTPVGVGDGSNWATNWEITTNATQIAPVSESVTRNALPASGTSVASPNLFANPAAAFKAFTFTLPGDSGDRSNIRVPGPKAINLGLSKEFRLFTVKDIAHKLQLRAEAFNLTNTAVMSGQSLDIGSGTSFGKFSSQLGSPRQMQFALRYSF
jgi:hypothetical protein